MSTPIAVSTTRLRHHVRLVHASTGAALTPLRARLVPAPVGWVARPAADGVVVTTRDGLPAPADEPELAVTLGAAPWGEVLDLPDLPGQPPRTVMVALDAGTDEIDVPVAPVPMTLEVHLAEASTGDPATGLDVLARATRGPSPRPEVPLPETDQGTYVSAAVVWTAALTPFDLVVEGDLLRTAAMDFTTRATRVRLVAST